MTVPEIVARPIDAVQRLFQQAGYPQGDEDWGVETAFEAAVASLGSCEIPCVNAQSAELLPHHSLVCFYGMVQDTLNPEYYIGVYQRPDGQLVTTKYRDPDSQELEQADDSGGQPIVWERRPVVLVPIPGLSHWSAAQTLALGRSETKPSPSSSVDAVTAATQTGVLAAAAASPAQVLAARSQRPKRERSSDADHAAEPETDAPTQQHPPQPPPELDREDSGPDTAPAGDQGRPGIVVTRGSAAAGLDEDEDSAMAGVDARPRTRRREEPPGGGAGAEDGGAAAPAAAAGSAAGAGIAGEPAGEAAAVMAVAGEGDPAGEVAGSCIAYLYDHGICPRLHEVVQVIGVLSHVPQLASLEDDMYGNALENELASLELGGGHPHSHVSGDRSAGHGAQAVVAGAGAGSGEGAADALVAGAGATAELQLRLADEAVRAAHPPTSKVMRIHAILVRRSPPLTGTPQPNPPQQQPSAIDAPAAQQPVSSDNPNPSPIDAAVPPATTTAAAAGDGTAVVSSLRSRALALLRSALGGDSVAAEYVLLLLLARVAARGEAAALGELALNISGCPAAAATAASSVAAACGPLAAPPLRADQLGAGPGPLAAALHAAVSCLVPLSVALPASLPAFNGVSWGPTRDTLRERTLPAPLQLAPGTVTLLDETVMGPGHFTEKGFKSFQTLTSVVRRQELMYDFETSQHPVPVDLPLIVLTEGRSLLRDAIPLRLPLRATQPFPSVQQILDLTAPTVAVMATAPTAAAATAASDDADTNMAPADAKAESAASSGSAATADWSAVRLYLATARAAEDYELAEGIPALLERYFVEARRQDAAGDAANNAAAAQGAVAPAAAAAAVGGGMTPEEFHLKLTLARLLVLSHGERRLSRERWQQLLQLEHIREARLRLMV